jgi:MSHA pilin protein MshD
MCTNKSQRGISLIELILFIIIVSIALTGLLMVMNMTTKSSVDPLLRKQALAIAESLLEEIELQDFLDPEGKPYDAAKANQANRATFDDIFDYHNFATTGIFPADGSLIGVTGLANYNVSVVVTSITWGTIPAAQITVTVTDPSNQTLQAVGYRVNY